MNDSRKPRAEATHFMMIAHANIILLVVRTQVWLQRFLLPLPGWLVGHVATAGRPSTASRVALRRFLSASVGASERSIAVGLTSTLLDF